MKHRHDPVNSETPSAIVASPWASLAAAVITTAMREASSENQGTQARREREMWRRDAMYWFRTGGHIFYSRMAGYDPDIIYQAYREILRTGWCQRQAEEPEEEEEPVRYSLRINRKER